jgi:hypothetical protein
MTNSVDEERWARDLAAQVEIPAGVDSWRGRITAERRAPVPPPAASLRLRLAGAFAAIAAAATVAVVGVALTGHTLGRPQPGVGASPALGQPTAGSSPAASSTTQPGIHVSPSSASAVPAASAKPSPSHATASSAATPTAAPAPSWPGSSNTGVTGTLLTPHPGDLHVTTANTTVSNLSVSGSVYIEADNVTLHNVKVVSNLAYVVRQMPGTSGLIVEDSEIAGSEDNSGIFEEGDSITVRRCNIHDLADGINPAGGNATIVDNYIHDLDPNSASANGIYLPGGESHVTIRHNTIENKSGNGAVQVFTDYGSEVDILVDNNLLAGGSWTVRGGTGAGSQQIRFTNNHFSRVYFENGGSYGPATAFDAHAAGNVWSGNVWDDTGAPVSPS